MAFPERLKEIRKELGLNQKEMSEKLGIGYRTYQRYEEGGVIPNGLEVFLELYLSGYSIDWLVTGDGDKLHWKSPSVDPVIREIWEWLETISQNDPGYKEWFRIEFSKRFPEFKKG